MGYKIVPYIENEKIVERIKEIGERITKEYKGKSLKLICTLKGGAPILCELMKHIDNEELTIDFMAVSSYGNETESRSEIKILKDLDEQIEGENVIIVEDIVDTGKTLRVLIDLLNTRKPNSIKVCTLLDKPSRRVTDVKVDYRGFEIEDKFVLGFGLDYKQKYRQLPYVGYIVFDEE